MTETVTSSALFRLVTFLSPAFPIGAFTYSHGLEQVIEQGRVTSSAELQAWLEDILRFGAGRTDAILLKKTFLAAINGDTGMVSELRDLGLALQPSRERYLETSAQGTAFMETITKSWMPDSKTTAGKLFRTLASEDRDAWPYPVALGLTCAAHAIPEDASVRTYMQAFAANIVSAAIRLVPLGQNEGQKAMAAMEPVIFDVAMEVREAEIDDLGSCTFLADIASMAHETQYSRLFRS